MRPNIEMFADHVEHHAQCPEILIADQTRSEAEDG